jgi:hypothetical protein
MYKQTHTYTLSQSCLHLKSRYLGPERQVGPGITISATFKAVLNINGIYCFNIIKTGFKYCDHKLQHEAPELYVSLHPNLNFS